MLRRLVTNKKLLVIVPVVMALVLAGLFLPVMKVSIEPYGRLSLESKITISIGYEAAYASPGWVSPTGFVDGGSVWTSETLAYDEDTLTFAYVNCPSGWSDYLELTVAEITCDKVQLWMGRVNTQVTDVEVDVYYSSAWDNIYSGPIVVGSFQEFPIGSEQSVTAMRIRFFASKASRQADIYEADFNEVSLVPDITNTPTSKAFGTVSESTDYWSTVTNPPTWPLDDAECFFTVTNNSGAAVDIAIRAINFGGGVGWTLAGSPGENIVTLKAGKSGDSLETNMVTLTTSNQSFITGLADATSKKWEIKLETGTFTDGVGKSSTVTLTATLS